MVQYKSSLWRQLVRKGMYRKQVELKDKGESSVWNIRHR
jgi:hypothetical protein